MLGSSARLALSSINGKVMLVSLDWVSSESLEDVVEVVELELSLDEKFAEESDGGEIAGVGDALIFNRFRHTN